jgi:ABC-type transporter Mla subunit MlaD
MRATIRFEIDLDQVEGTMGTLVAQEAHNLRAAADILEDYTGTRTQALEEVTEALRLLHQTSTQLQQYRDMLVSFKRAKFETMLPQPAEEITPLISGAMGDIKQTTEEMSGLVANIEDLKSATANADQFGSFLDKLNEFAGGDQDEPEPKEG